MRKPRLLHILEATTAGVRRYVTQLIEGQRAEWDVAVACPLVRQTHYGDVAFVEDLQRLEIPIYPLPLRRSIGLHDAKAARAVRTLLRHERFDLIHTHSSKAGFVGRFAARASRTPVVHTPNGLYFLEQSGLKRGFYLLLERLAGRWSSALIAVSEGECAVIRQHRLVAGDRVQLIENGVDAVRIRASAKVVDPQHIRRSLGLPEDAPVIGGVGRMAPQKNPLAFVRAARRVKDRVPDAHFVWCGDGELRTSAQELARELGVPLTVSGHLENVWPVMRLFDVFVLPSLYEGLPFTLLEAMALGVPAVATDVVGTRDVLQDASAGWSVPVGDDAALARAIAQALTDVDEARRRTAVARQLVETRFSARRMIEAHDALYRRVIGMPARQAG